MDKVTLEIGLNIRSCHVTNKQGNAIESSYLKPTFKSGRNTINNRGVITLDKEGRMNSKIYINQVPKELGLPFFKRLVKKRGPII